MKGIQRITLSPEAVSEAVQEYLATRMIENVTVSSVSGSSTSASSGSETYKTTLIVAFTADPITRQENN